MKLLEDIPSTLTQRPPQRRVRVTLAVMAGFLLVATVAGAILVAQSAGDTGSAPDRAVGDSDIALTDWANTAEDTCLATASAHPVLTQRPAAADAAAIHAGVQALASALGDQTQPTDEAERTQVAAVVQLADQAESSWAALADASQVTNDQLAAATQAAHALVDGLIGLGANCSSLLPE